MLRAVPDDAAHLLEIVKNGPAPDQRIAAGGPAAPGDHVDDGTLPRPVVAQEGKDLVVREGDADPIYRRLLAELLLQVVENHIVLRGHAALEHPLELHPDIRLVLVAALELLLESGGQLGDEPVVAIHPVRRPPKPGVEEEPEPLSATLVPRRDVRQVPRRGPAGKEGRGHEPDGLDSRRRHEVLAYVERPQLPRVVARIQVVRSVAVIRHPQREPVIDLGYATHDGGDVIHDFGHGHNGVELDDVGHDLGQARRVEEEDHVVRHEHRHHCLSRKGEEEYIARHSHAREDGGDEEDLSQQRHAVHPENTQEDAEVHLHEDGDGEKQARDHHDADDEEDDHGGLQAEGEPPSHFVHTRLAHMAEGA
mmetsp:Transcript_26807/g.78969  ORF Transcript_26807/g.78969 Transcript_26807/m.78969 type:complete len:365 (-) Transcript_26807:970-2064(-)